MAKLEFDATDAASEIDDIERGCRYLTSLIEEAEGDIEMLEDEVVALKARIAELEATNDDA